MTRSSTQKPPRPSRSAFQCPCGHLLRNNGTTHQRTCPDYLRAYGYPLAAALRAELHDVDHDRGEDRLAHVTRRLGELQLARLGRATALHLLPKAELCELARTVDTEPVDDVASPANSHDLAEAVPAVDDDQARRAALIVADRLDTVEERTEVLLMLGLLRPSWEWIASRHVKGHARRRRIQRR